MFSASEHPPKPDVAVAPWGDEGGVFQGGLPSWMAPKNDDDVEAAEENPPRSGSRSRPPSNAPSVPPPSQPVRLSFHPPTMPPPMRDYDGEIAALQTQVDSCVRSMARMRRRVLEASQRQLVQLALTISERVVGRELRQDPELVVRWASEGVRALAAEDSLTITVSPDVGEVLSQVAQWPGDRAVDVSIDESLSAGSCEVRGELGKVDASVRARIAAMCEALEVEEEPDAQE